MKAIIFKVQKLVRGNWEPVAARVLDVTDGTGIAGLLELLAPFNTSRMRILIEERQTRKSNGAPVHIDELVSRMQDLQNGVRRAMEVWRNPRQCETLMASAQNEFRNWAEEVGLVFDWTKPGDEPPVRPKPPKPAKPAVDLDDDETL